MKELSISEHRQIREIQLQRLMADQRKALTELHRNDTLKEVVDTLNNHFAYFITSPVTSDWEQECEISDAFDTHKRIIAFLLESYDIATLYDTLECERQMIDKIERLEAENEKLKNG